MRFSIAIVLCLLIASPTRAEDPQEAPTAPADESFARIDQVLTQLEQRSDGLKDIRCKVRFVEDDQINLTRRTKVGQILFQMTKPNPTFLVHFEKTEVDGMRGRQEWFLLDGRWLFEVNERIEQVTRREMVRPGESIDLFDIERTPFPLPFGQKKDKILQQFSVAYLAPVPGDPPNTDHLICVPKPGTRMDRRCDKLEFYVRRDIHLPCKIVVTKNDGLEVHTAEFPDLSEGSINAGVTKKDFAKPAAWKGYKEVVVPLEPAKNAAP